MFKMAMGPLLLALLVSQLVTLANSTPQSCITDSMARLEQDFSSHETNTVFCDNMKDMVECLFRAIGINPKEILTNPSARQAIKNNAQASLANLDNTYEISCDLDKMMDEIAAETGNPGTKISPSVFTTFLSLLASLWCLSLIKMSGLFVTV